MNMILEHSKLRAMLLGAALSITAGAAQAGTVTLSNGAAARSIASFGYPDSQTYGEVFTAPVTGTLTSFTLWLDSGVGSLYGGVGTWNGGSTFGSGYGSPVNLFQSAAIGSTGAQAFIFDPDIPVTAGDQYVAYLSVFGVSGVDQQVSMPFFPRATSATPGIDYFVFQNSSHGQGGPQGNPSWDYWPVLGNAQFSAAFTAFASAPEPGGWALMLAGIGGLGAALRARLNGAQPRRPA
jgi:hypothetical protein